MHVERSVSSSFGVIDLDAPFAEGAQQHGFKMREVRQMLFEVTGPCGGLFCHLREHILVCVVHGLWSPGLWAGDAGMSV